jgi:hypothetical protein
MSLSKKRGPLLTLEKWGDVNCEEKLCAHFSAIVALSLIAQPTKAEDERKQPCRQMWVMESRRWEVSALVHEVFQYLMEFARNQEILQPCNRDKSQDT